MAPSFLLEGTSLEETACLCGVDMAWKLSIDGEMMMSTGSCAVR